MGRSVEISGGDKLKAYLDKTARSLGKAKTLRTGFLEGATYPDGTSVALVAFLQNFGSGKTPPRPFFSTMVTQHGPEWPDKIATLLKLHNYDAEVVLRLMGMEIEADLQQSIIDTNAPPLSEVTLMLRKMFGNDHSAIRGRDVGEAAHRVAEGESTAGVSDKPLVWTGQLIHSIDSEVS